LIANSFFVRIYSSEENTFLSNSEGGFKMPIQIIGLLEDVQPYEGAKGFGANITVSCKLGKKTKRVSFLTKNKEFAQELEKMLDTDVILMVELNQNNFGTRIGEIISISA